jgi:hypothetical protein
VEAVDEFGLVVVNECGQSGGEFGLVVNKFGQGVN